MNGLRSPGDVEVPTKMGRPHRSRFFGAVAGEIPEANNGVGFVGAGTDHAPLEPNGIGIGQHRRKSSEDDVWESLQEAADAMRARELEPGAAPFVLAPAMSSEWFDADGFAMPGLGLDNSVPVSNSVLENHTAHHGNHEPTEIDEICSMSEGTQQPSYPQPLPPKKKSLVSSTSVPSAAPPAALITQRPDAAVASVTDALRKTQLCQFYVEGHCRRSSEDCHFAHGERELRQPGPINARPSNGWDAEALPRPRPATEMPLNTLAKPRPLPEQPAVPGELSVPTQQVPASPGAEWGHVHNDALAFTHQIEEEDAQVVREYQEQQEREKEQRRLVAIEKQREKQRAEEEAKEEQRRRAEEQRRVAQETKDRQRKEQADAEARRKQAAQDAEQRQAAELEAQRQRAKEEKLRKEEEEIKRKKEDDKKSAAKVAEMQQKQMEDKKAEREAAEKKKKADEEAAQRRREEAAQRAKMEKEAAELRRQAKKEAAEKKKQKEKEETERRRQIKRQNVLEAERAQREKARQNQQRHVLDMLSTYEELEKLVAQELERLDRLMLDLGLTIDSADVHSCISEFPENSQQRMKTVMANGGRTAFGVRAIAAIFTEETDLLTQALPHDKADVDVICRALEALVEKALLHQSCEEASCGQFTSKFDLPASDPVANPTDANTEKQEEDAQSENAAKTEELKQQRTEKAAFIVVRMLDYGAMEAFLAQQRQTTMETRLALDFDDEEDSLEGKEELPDKEIAELKAKEREKERLKIEKLGAVMTDTNKSLARIAGARVAGRLRDEGEMMARHGLIQEASDILKSGLVLVERCIAVVSDHDSTLNEAHQKLCKAVGLVNLALKFSGLEAAAVAYGILTSPPTAASPEELEKEEVGSVEVAAEVCFQRALHEHDLKKHDKAMLYVQKAVRICPDPLLWGGDVGVPKDTARGAVTASVDGAANEQSSTATGTAKKSNAADIGGKVASSDAAAVGWTPLERPIAYSIALVLLAVLECHVAAFGGSLCLLVFAWCKVCRSGGADFFTWVQGLSVLCLLWGLAVLAFLYGVYVWVAAATYLALGGMFVWLWDSSLLLDKSYADGEGENTTMSVITRVLASTDHYTTLGIVKTADQPRVKEAYSVLHRLLSESRVTLPDIKDALKKVERAYEVLGDATERKCYNKLLSTLPANGTSWSSQNPWDTEDTGYGVHMLACGVCGKAHRRIPVDRDPRRARWCTSCHRYHEAFIGDGWAETDPHAASSIFTAAFSPTEYYVCMEDGIFQVTEWAQCQQIVIEPNTHRVPFTITTNPQQNGKAKPTAATDPKVSKKAARNSSTVNNKKKPKARR